MARRSRFTPEERLAAVRRAFEDAEGATAVAADIGVSPGTIYRWAAEPESDTGGDPRPTLMRACLDLLAQGTFDEITVDAVADAAGMSARAVFHWFPSRRALFEGAVADAGARFAAAMARAELPDVAPLERLGLLAASAVDAAREVPAAHVLFRDLGVPAPEDPTQTWHGMYELACRRLLDDAVAAGDLPKGFDTDAGARLFAAAARGVTGCLFDSGAPIHPEAIRVALRRLPGILV